MFNLIYKYDPPQLVKTIFRDVIFYSKCDKILLSFDDGPNPGTTELILKSLNRNNVKAFFFVTLDNSLKYPNLVKEIISEGHSLGSHYTEHKNLLITPPSEVKSSLIKMKNEFIDKFGLELKYFRPPYGKFNPTALKVLKQLNMKMVLWSLITNDYKNDLNIVKFAIDKKLKNNTIVVFHDSVLSQSIIEDSLDYLYKEVSEKGFLFGEPSICLK